MGDTMKIDPNVNLPPPSSDLPVVPTGSNMAEPWCYTPKNVRDALMLICRDEVLAEQFITEAKKEIDRVRGKFDGRCVSPKEAHAILGPSKSSESSLAQLYVLMIQEEAHRS
jgi:hypothetical protein